MMPAVHALRSRGLRPIAELAEGRDHGDRLRYAAGCRCKRCRAANSAYENRRVAARKAGEWNGIIDASKARAWIAHLSAHGVGRRAIAYASDVSETVLCEIRSGRKTKIRALTERRILAVSIDMALDGALLPAGPTWLLIDELLAAGITKRQIAARIGQTNGALQLSRESVTVRHAYQVKKLHGELIDAGAVLVDAKRTWRLIDALRGEGYTDKQIARNLGLPDDDELRISKLRVQQRFEQLVIKVHERLTT